MSVNTVRIHDCCELIANTLLGRNVEIFVSGDRLVEVATSKLSLGGEVQEATVLKAISRSGFASAVSQHVRLLAGPEEKQREIEPPRKITDTIFENTYRYPLRPIVRISEGPMLLRDGRIVSARGYDAETATFITRRIDLPAIPEHPTRADALAALAVLDQLLDGFEFDTPNGRSATLAAMIAATCRNLCDVVPMTLFTASMPGSGKSFLFRLVSAIALGRTGALMAAGRDEAETEKRLDSVLQAGVNVCCLDNVNGMLAGDKLCQLIEQPQIEIRPLGSTARVEFRNNLSMFATGNNSTLSSDMVRRTLVVRLAPKTDNPEAREFNFNPLEMVLGDRPRYLAAVFTVVRAWQQAWAAGEKPRRPGLASFEAWNDGVRSALLWLGQPDPLETQAAGREMDPERQKAAAIFPAWRAAFGDRDLTVAELEKELEGAALVANEDPEAGNAAAVTALSEALKAHMPAERKGQQTPLSRRLGYFLRPLRGRVSGKLMLEANTLKDRQAWKVMHL